MNSRLRIAAVLLLPWASSAAAQPRVDASAATAGQSAAGGQAAASVTAGAAMSPSLTAPIQATALPAGGISAVTAGPAAAGAIQASPAAASVSPSAAAPARLPGSFSPAAAVPSESSPATATGEIPVSRGLPARVPSAARSAGPTRGSTARDGSAPSREDGAAAPTAGSSLNGAARKITEAGAVEAAGGDGMSVSHALDKVFDAQTARAASHAAAPGVAGRAQGAREAIAQKVGIANTSSPADAPSLYQDAIKTAKDALPAPVAEAVAQVVRGFASHKADASMDELAHSAYRAAAAAAAPETGRALAAFDKWETLLGAPGKPLISNAAALKSDVKATLEKAQAGGAPSVPHVWFAKKDGSLVAVLPGSGVAPIPSLAAAFAIAPSALAPETALSAAYRQFAADPRASTGAGLVYRARRTLGAAVPSAALSAARFWLRAAFESAWRRLVALFRAAPAYRLAEKSGQDALRRDAAFAATARTEAAAAERLLSAGRLTAGGLRAAFGALGRAAAALEKLGAGADASAYVEDLRRSFESEASALSLRPGDEWPAAGQRFVAGPGGPAHWARRIEEEAGRAVDARYWRARGGADFVNLGAEGSIAAGAAAAVKEASGASPAMVALDDRLWARARGAHGEARLSAELRSTSSGGSIELYVERGDAALARRLEDLGLSTFSDGAGLRASAGSQDFARDAEELGPLAARAMAAALGAPEPAAAAGLRELADETRRDPASAAKLASLFDGRESFARAPVIGLVGEYEALAPTSAVLGGRAVLVSALRDPATGLLAYARASKPGGAPLGAAELRALLRAK